MTDVVGVVGLGTMGAGIVEVFARCGLTVVATEIDEAALARGRGHLTASTDRAVSRGKLSPADRDALHGRVTFEVGLAGLAAADLVIEAVPERLDLKRRLFGDLDRICKPSTVLATNTSSLSVTEIAVATGRPDRVIGLHFFNPAPVMKLVEIVRTVVTAPAVVDRARELCAKLGKTGVTIGDRAGFIANALLFGYLNQAVSMLENGHATRDDIDAAMTLGAGLPMGPFALLDLIGLDTAQQILDTMYRHGGRNRRHAAAPLLRQMVTAGLLGRKSGEGFHAYRAAGGPADADPPADARTPAGSDAPADPDAPVGAARVAVLDDTLAEALPGYGFTPAADADVVLVVAAGDRPVIDLAVATGRPRDVVGVHLVGDGLAELVRTVRTSGGALAAARAVCDAAGRRPVVCTDRAGLVVEALLLPYLNDAVAMLAAGYATAADVDHAMTLGCGYRTGPFQLLGELGPDVVLAGLERLYREQREPGVAPVPLLRQLVTAGAPLAVGDLP